MNDSISPARRHPALAGNEPLPGGHVILARPPGESPRLGITASYLWEREEGEVEQVCVYFDSVDPDGRPANEQWLKRYHQAEDLGPLESFYLAPERSEALDLLLLAAAESPQPLASNALILCKALWTLRAKRGAELDLQGASYALQGALLDNESERRRLAAFEPQAERRHRERA